MKKNRILVSAVALALGGLGVASAEAPPTAEEMWEMIKQQQKTIEELKSQISQNNQKVEEVADTVEDAVEAVEVAQTSSGASWADKTTVGGYGELHYNNLDDQNDTIGGDDSFDQVDFHRFVLYFGHQFNDDIRFFSELEIEHSLAGDDKPGEVEVEQAWLEMDITDQHRVRGGLDILPIGLINPTHEPNTFYGVERNRIETEIIPATWWEAGVGLIGEVAPGWNYDVVAHSGLMVPISGGSAFRPRSGRLKVAEARDQDIAVTGRVRYTGVPGLEVGVSGQYQADITGTADTFDIGATLFEGHVDWKHASGFGLRALYARWDLDSDNGLDPASVNADTLDGWYIEPAYRFRIPNSRLGEIGVFARYSMWDERNRLSGADFRFEEFDEITVGMNWWPHQNVAVKFDYQWQDADGPVDSLFDGFNLGIGYQF